MTDIKRSRRSVGRPSKSDTVNRRDQILDTSVRLFAERGFDQVKIKDIAEEAEVATSLVHHHFGKRTDLCDECAKFVIEEFRKVLAGLDDKTERLKASDLDQFGSYLILGLRERTHLLRFLARLFFENHDGANEVFAEYFAILHGQTCKLKEADLLRDDIDPVWVTMQTVYLQLGTIFLHEQVRGVLGADPYRASISRERTHSFIKIAKEGLLKTKEKRPSGA